MTTTLLVVNRYAAASTPRLVSRVLKVLRGYSAVDVIETVPGQTTARVFRRVDRSVDRIYVLGGDGTVGDVAGALTESDIDLGVIPCGTTNVVARECGIPLQPSRAAEALARSRRTRIFQTWSTGRGTLILNMGVGFDARLMLHTTMRAKRRWGILAVAVTALREVVRYDFPEIDIEGQDATGRPFKLRGTYMLVGNLKRYAGDAIMLPRADPADELLDLLVFRSCERMRLAAFWALSAIPGSPHIKLDYVRSLRARILRVDSATGVEVHLNGDPHGQTPVQLEPSGRVRLLVPV